MTENSRVEDGRHSFIVRSVATVQVCMADTGRNYLDNDLVVLQFSELHILEGPTSLGERSARYQRLRLHG